MPSAAVPALLARGPWAPERVRAEIAELPFLINGKGVPVTVSVGLSSLKRGLDSVAELLKRADVALYEAKSGGRNRVVARAA